MCVIFPRVLGHSRTIMGCEQLRDGSINLLVLDPSHSPYQMGQLSDTSTAPAAMRLIRKSEAAMKARQYQIVAVVGTIDSEAQYQVRSTLLDQPSIECLRKFYCSKARCSEVQGFRRIGENCILTDSNIMLMLLPFLLLAAVTLC